MYLARDFDRALDYISSTYQSFQRVDYPVSVMQNEIEKNVAHPRKKKRPRGFLPLLLAICAVSGAAVIAFQYYQLQIDEKLVVPSGNTVLPAQAAKDSPVANDRQQQFSISPSVNNSENEDNLNNGSESASKELGLPADRLTGLGQGLSLPAEEARQTTAIEPVPATPVREDPEQAVTAIDSFYSNLDQQPYVKNFNFGVPSKVYFSQLIQKLLDTPPVVSGETSDLFTILQNTAHLFRVLGRDNIIALKAIITQEKNDYESIFADFYTVSKRPDYLSKSFSINLQDDALYDYAGFFLTTMGGRLYLSRRDASLRMIVSYYSILVVDEAVQSGRNRHGIDLRPLIDSLISEVESNGSQLKLKEYYLDNLYDLKEKYL